jgi:flagellar hook protein FlgE
MSFQTGLSGLNAAAKNLDVIGNNIANSNTVGAKASRTEFAAIVASAIGPSGGGGAGGGIGVEIGAISQQFSQGTINITGNSLDVAVNGGGFYELQLSDGSSAYTRDGQFKLDASGNMVTNTGANVMGYATDFLGNATSTTLSKMAIPTGAPVPAQATSAITAEFNLDARAKVAATAVPPTPYTTYGTSLNAYDSQGVPVPVQLYFVKSGADNWDIYTGDPAAPTPKLASITFDTNGKIVPPASPITIPLTSSNSNIGAFNPPPTLDISKATQYGTAFSISNLTQDGYTAGNLTGVAISKSGVITTRYSNGQSQARGQLALADFRNVQGLQPVGQGNWVETIKSGQPVHGKAAQGNFGDITSGALESSNVDLTAELVAMMTAQRDYQSNAQTIKTQDQVLSTLVNLR